MNEAEPFNHLTFGQVFDRCVLVYRRSLFEFLALGILASIPSTLFIGIWLHKSAFRDVWHSVFEEFDFGALTSMFGGLMDDKHLWYVVPLHAILVGLSTLLLKASVISFVTKRVYLDERPLLSSVLKGAVCNIPRLLCWTLLCLVGSVVISALFGLAFWLVEKVVWVLLLGDKPLVRLSCHVLVGAFTIYATSYIFISFLFCIPVIVIERSSAYKAFQRAWALIEGQRLFVFYSLVVHFNLLAMIIYLLVGTVLAPAGPAAVFIGIQAVKIFLGPFQEVVVSVLYWNARVHAEGCDQAAALADSRPQPLLSLDQNEVEESSNPLTENLLDEQDKDPEEDIFEPV